MESSISLETEENNFFSSIKKNQDIMVEVFEFGYTEELEKFVKCKLCYQKTQIIKMKYCNTAGTTSHLKLHQKEYFVKAFPDKSSAMSEVII